jgi:hypothetical protein
MDLLVFALGAYCLALGLRRLILRPGRGAEFVLTSAALAGLGVALLFVFYVVD